MGSHLAVKPVVIAEADVFISHYPDVFDHIDDVAYELGILIGSPGQGSGLGQGGYEIHIPEGADEFF